MPRRDGGAASCRSCHSGLALMVKAIARFTTFLTQVREELKLVTWPTREELIGSALVVFVGVVLLAGFISVCTFVLSRVAQALLR
ncbi:MAG: preprotein translocase subunit SecE [Candidatus Omnitrophota bacterium]|nr:preprotein translocase subunit SecE [Candidatus Omnitrophota bacterium]